MTGLINYVLPVVSCLLTQPVCLCVKEKIGKQWWCIVFYPQSGVNPRFIFLCFNVYSKRSNAFTPFLLFFFRELVKMCVCERYKPALIQVHHSVTQTRLKFNDPLSENADSDPHIQSPGCWGVKQDVLLRHLEHLPTAFGQHAEQNVLKGQTNNPFFFPGFRQIRAHVTWLLGVLFGYRERPAVLSIFSSKLWGLHSESKRRGGRGGCEQWESLDQFSVSSTKCFKDKTFNYIHRFWLLLCLFYFSLVCPPSGVFASSFLFSSSPSVLFYRPPFSFFSLDAIHLFSWAVRSCDPCARNQTALPTARPADKRGQDAYTHTQTRTHTQMVNTHL